MRQSKFIIFIFLFFILTGCFAKPAADSTALPKPTEIKSVVIGGQTISVELAITKEEQVQGLANREAIPENHGMLFVYPNYQMSGFWMKGMQFPLDIIWIKDERIVGWVSAQPVSASEELEIYYPPEPVDKVLELNFSLVEKNNWQIGEKVIFNY